MPGHPRPEWGQGHSEWDEEESRKPDPSRVRHTSPQILGDNQEEDEEEEEEEEEEDEEEEEEEEEEGGRGGAMGRGRGMARA